MEKKQTKKTTVAPKKDKKVVAPAPAAKEAKPVKAAVAKEKPKKVSVQNLSHGIGRRKSSVARVWLRKGTGAIVVNGEDFKSYFDTDINRMEAATPFRILPISGSFDVNVNVCGGGMSSQAGAVKLGIARAFLKTDETLRPVLRSNNLLTVDSRVKERKKYGQKAARRKFQFVKR